MALTSKSFSRWPSRLLFLVRFLGLTGLLAAVAGGALIFLLWNVTPALGDLAWKDSDTYQTFSERYYDTSKDALMRQSGDLLCVAAYAFFGGIAGILFCLVLEGVVILRKAAISRSGAALVTALQIVLAVVLLFGVNVFSIWHYARLDCTTDHRFTLDPNYQKELRQLKGETTVVLYQMHKTSSHQSDKPDAYDSAAGRKIVEKVKDLVDQLREFGPQFKVEVLDTDDEDHPDQLERLTKDNPILRKAIDAAQENSIFFHAKRDGQELVQRLGFNEFYLLDKVASKSEDEGEGNLVLRYQTLEPFIHRILSLDEKRPRIGIAVIHPRLTTESSREELTLAGVKKTLLAQGFDVSDVILKKWTNFGPPEPSVSTFEENRYESLEAKLAGLDAAAKSVETELQTAEAVVKQWRTSSLEELTKLYSSQLRGRKVTEAMRRRQVEAFEEDLSLAQSDLAKIRELREKTALEKERLGVDRDSLLEQKRLSDVKAKFARALADIDLLIVPRMTLMDVTIGDAIPQEVHRLDGSQVDAIKDFLKSGKPVLACFGPASEPLEEGRPRDARGPDSLEQLLGDLGFRFNKQTVLYNVESSALAEQRSEPLNAGSTVDVPGLDFLSEAPSARPFVRFEEANAEAKPANPLRLSLRVEAKSAGDGLLLRARHPRPIGFDPDKAKAIPYHPEFLITAKDSWNDDQPFPTAKRIPHPELSKPDEAARGTIDEKRRGPFSIGVAVEAPLPSSWFHDQTNPDGKVRVAAIGHGHIFNGSNLSSAQEQVLLTTCNWLLRREDRLPREGEKWSFPRAHVPPLERQLWEWAMLPGLPIVIAYLGVIVVMIRRLR